MVSQKEVPNSCLFIEHFQYDKKLLFLVHFIPLLHSFITLINQARGGWGDIF